MGPSGQRYWSQGRRLKAWLALRRQQWEQEKSYPSCSFALQRWLWVSHWGLMLANPLGDLKRPKEVVR